MSAVALRPEYFALLQQATKCPTLRLIRHPDPEGATVDVLARAREREACGSVSADPEWYLRLDHVETIVRRYWPLHWPLFEACLATYVSLLLQKVSQGVGVVLVGDSGAGKGTILETFRSVSLTVWRDKFTPSSILSGFAGEGSSKKSVDERALFRAVRHRALVVGDLGALLSGGDKQAQMSLYSIIPPWFDGGGLVFDTGTHGVIGSKGDFSFVLIGGKTPFDLPTWRAMSTVGPRFLFLRVAKLRKEERVSSRVYDDAKHEIREAVGEFLGWVFERYAPRSMEWPELSDAHEAKLAEYAQLMADGQTLSCGGFGDSSIVRPTANHLLQRLAIIVCGRALLYQRKAVDESDLMFAKRFVRNSAPGQRGRVLLAMSEGADEVNDIVERTGVSYDTVKRTLEDLAKLGIVECVGVRHREGRGQPPEVWKRRPEDPDPEREALKAEEGM